MGCRPFMSGAVLVVAVGACAGGGDDATPFTPPAIVSEATANGATPMFAVTPEGGTVLSWVAASEDGVEQLHVQVQRDDAGTTTSTLTDPLGSIEPHGEAPPQVVVSPSGAIHALYTVGRDVGRRFPESALRHARSDDGGLTWSEPSSVNTGEVFGSHNFHALLAESDGSIRAAWLSSVGGSSAVWMRASRDGGDTWEVPVALHEAPTCPCCRTGLAVAPDGSLYASWRKILEGDIRDVTVARSDDGGRSWGDPVRPRADNWVFPGCPHAGPSLKVGGDGVVHISWWTGVKGEAGVWYASSSDRGTTWTSQPIAIGEESLPAHAQVALGDNGLVLVSWDDGLGARPVVKLRVSTDGGASFGRAMQLSDPAVAATFPVLALAGDSVLVAWTQVSDSVHRAMLADRPDMSHHDARMPLPRVGQQEVVVRKAALSQLIGGE